MHFKSGCYRTAVYFVATKLRLILPALLKMGYIAGKGRKCWV